MIDYDLELRYHNDVLRRTYGIRASDRFDSRAWIVAARRRAL
jgi:hypothetical protein